MKKQTYPISAFLSVTLRCNSRCLHCDIWKSKKDEPKSLEIYKKLPISLRMIDITGGEPFLRDDLVKLVGMIKKTCPRARLLITTNGLLPAVIIKQAPQLLQLDPKMAFRVSLDGMKTVHDEIRGVPGAFKKAVKTLNVFKKLRVKDLGIIFTLMELNKKEIRGILDFCKKQKLQFSLNLIHDSPVYFGKGHLGLRPKLKSTKEGLQQVTKFFVPSFNPKNWAKSWFYKKLSDYAETGKRPLRCGAGENFFYLDPFGDVYLCQFKNWKIGNLKKQSFSEIWQGEKRKKYLKIAQKCNGCFMICTAKDEMRKHPFLLLR